MTEVVADTQSILWFVFDQPRLSPAADAALTAAQAGRILISTITLVEVSYLSDKKSFPYAGAYPRLLQYLADPNFPLDLIDVTLDVALALHTVPRNEVPDMPDRIIAATAVARGLPLVSSDGDIRGSAFVRSRIPVIW